MQMTAFQEEVMALLGIPPQDVAPVSLEMQRSMYAMAYGMYEKGDYRSASQLFTQLVLSDPFSEHYWLGLAGAKQMAQDYRAAVQAWGLLALLREGDPLPHYHAAECLLSLDEKEEASKALNAALELCKDEGLCEKINLLKGVHDAQH